MICTKCKLEKPKHLFNKSSRHTSGVCPWCKVCESKIFESAYKSTIHSYDHYVFESLLTETTSSELS